MGTKTKERKVQGDAAFFEAGQRFAFWVKKATPVHTSKWLQDQLKISEAKAERALAGKVSKDILERALRKWKWAIAPFILEPYCGRLVYQNNSERLTRIEAEIQAMRAESAGDADAQVVTRVDRTLTVFTSAGVDRLASDEGREAHEEGARSPRKERAS